MLNFSPFYLYTLQKGETKPYMSKLTIYFKIGVLVPKGEKNVQQAQQPT